MKLYLVQHGNAVSKEEDSQRPLSQKGAQDVEKVASFIRHLHLKVDLWHSVKLRAKQTAEILCEVVNTVNGLVEREGLRPRDEVEGILAEVQLSEHDVMIVGHMPFLSELASLLVAEEISAGIVAFKQGGIVCLEQNEDGDFEVAWAVIPQILP